MCVCEVVCWQICCEVVIVTYVCASSQVAPDCKVIIFPKDELDKANKDKKHFPPNFQVCKHSCHGYRVGGALQKEGCLRLQVMRWMLMMMQPLVMKLIFEDEEDLSDTDNEEEWEIYTWTCLSVAGVLVSGYVWEL